MSKRTELVGYLLYKQGGTFSRLKSSKRQFYVLDDRHWCLFFFRSEEDFRASRQPLGSIALSEAAITLAGDQDSHQFVVHSEGKEHILTAESHRAMMTWALALQTKRDAWDKMVTLGTKPEELRLTYTDDQQKAIKTADKPTSHGRKQSLQLNGGAHEALKKMVSVSWEKRRNSTLADIGLLRHSEVPKSVDAERKTPPPPTPSPIREPSPRQCEPIAEEDQKESSPETESASESDRLAGQEVEEAEDQESPLLRLRDTRSRSSSSDNEEGESRLLVLQNELISVKCELAKCLNKEIVYKTALETKEAELKQLKAECAQATKREIQDLKQKLEMLQSRNQFLNAEIQKLSRMLQQEQFRNHSKHLNLQEMSAEVDQLKRDYVFLLQSCIRITCTDGPEMMELYMYGEKRHKQRVFALLEEARKIDPTLPNIEGMQTSLCHVDSLGFKHLFVDKSLILHYVCRQLHRHYSTQLRSHERHVAAWRRYLKKHPDNVLLPTSELKALVRKGVPEQLRSRVWSALCRIKIKDLKEAKGAKYFESLCTKSAEAEIPEAYKRQISLDLLRTMPNNVNFCDKNSEGIQKMQAVLNAFCLHNPKLGYCQGMNFLVGMMLLFVSAEDAFWCLVAVVERYFPGGYFDQNLIGAQADQELLKELLRAKLPKISSHLGALDIELSTVTLTWFLSIFIDAVPIETLLRIWDCFLLEGPKVLFRFSLAVLLMQEEAILAKHDTVSIMRQLKAAAKLCFDVDGLISAAFEELEPFPKREELWSRRANFHNILLEKAKKKERELNALRERERMMAQVELEGPHNHLIECAAVWGKDKVWVCYSHHHGSKVSMIHCQENIMYRLHIEFESRVMCMHAPNDDTMLFGTYSRFVHAYHTISRKKMWEICLNACVLSLCSHQRDGVKQVFAGLADGTLAVVENVQGRLPRPEVFYVVIGSNPVTCLQLVGRRLWCACGPCVIILSARTLDLLDQFQTSSNDLDYIYKMVYSEQGVWISLRGSSILQLWDPHSLTCRLLYDVRDNYSSRAAKVDETYTNHARITCVLPLDSSALVGTADGTLVIYDVVARKSPSPSAPASPRPCAGQGPESGHAKQIQERLQKLLMEQQLQDGEKSRSDSPNLTPSSASRRESSASSMDSKDSGSEAEPEEAPPARRSPSLLPPEAERSPRPYARGLRKPSYIAPIEEEQGTKLEEEEEEEEARSGSESSSAPAQPKPVPVPSEQQNGLDHRESKDDQKSVHQNGEVSSDDIETDAGPSTDEEKKRKMSEPQEFSRFRHVDAARKFRLRSKRRFSSDDLRAINHRNVWLQLAASLIKPGDLVSTEGGDKVVSALEFQAAQLKAAKKRYQSMSAEDIPTWVAQEKPQPVISARGDVTFEYKSRLPSIKAFIRREANELASFLKGQQQQDEVPAPPPISKGRNCPLFSIRPPTLDLTDHQLFSTRHLQEPDDPPPKPVESKPPAQPPSAPKQQQADSRRSSGIPEPDLPPSYLASDEEFLSTAQFNDLLQLQDWTRTSRKGSDTASNVSLGSNEVPFAFELHLKEMIKISDKPIRCLLQAFCDEEMVIVSCAGYYGDDEAVLKWIREGDEKLWTNDPIVEVCPFTHTMKPSPFARSRLPRRASIATTALASDVDFMGRASIESGIAKVQNLLSRVSDRS